MSVIKDNISDQVDRLLSVLAKLKIATAYGLAIVEISAIYPKAP
jgi:hypothetical protein